jgi:hypothetical protein
VRALSRRPPIRPCRRRVLLSDALTRTRRLRPRFVSRRIRARTVGAVRSGVETGPSTTGVVGAGRSVRSHTQPASLGVPAESSTNSMYQPGGARAADDGARTSRPPGCRVRTSSSSRRWFMLTPCVVAAGAMSTALSTGWAPLTPTPNRSP